jgi:hypothetical protein
MQKSWDPEKRFPCVLGCGYSCDNKNDFSRHETYYAQAVWICKLSRTAQSAEGNSTCTSQGCTRKDSEHWLKDHIGQLPCSEKSLKTGKAGRMFFRSDHFTQHLRDHHGHLDLGTRYLASCKYELGNESFPRRCGFCGYCWLSYQDRVNHLESHFKNGTSLESWKDPWVDPPPTGDQTDDDPGNPGDDQDNDDGDNGHDEDGGDPFDYFTDYDNSGFYDLGQSGGGGGSSASADFFGSGYHFQLSELYEVIVFLHSSSEQQTARKLVLSSTASATWAEIEARQAAGLIWVTRVQSGRQHLSATEFHPASLRISQEVVVSTQFRTSLASLGDHGRSRVVAWKQTNLQCLTDDLKARVASILRDYHVMTTLRHPHIARAYGLSLQSHHLGIIMPSVEGTLQQILEKGPTTDVAARILQMSFGCLASALSYLHQGRVRHRDIKPANILVSNSRVILADFGLSRFDVEGSKTPFNTTSTRTNFDRRYAAPECMSNPRSYVSDKRGDVYSLAVSL